MSEPSKNRLSMAGWTMVDSKGEVLSDDNQSESRDSSPDLQEAEFGDPMNSALSLPLPQESTEVLELQTLTSPLNQNLLSHSAIIDAEKVDKSFDEQQPDTSIRADNQANDIGPDNCDPQMSLASPVVDNISAENATVSPDLDTGACNEDDFADKDKEESFKKENEDEEEIDQVEMEAIEPCDDTLNPYDPAEMDYEDADMQERRNSDSDSDFVQINEDNLEELVALRMYNIPHRSPSIGEEFNFLRPAEDDIREDGSDRGSHFEDFNEDTESSTEDNGDDRIESDQSEAGSLMNTGTDIGDLSAFADISNLPLEAGNVARNYRHRPNNRLSSLLNVVLSVVSILTMGISIGLIMATDQEMEEWQNGYHLQNEKISSLEWTLTDMNRVLHDSKEKIAAYDSVVKSFSKAGDATSNEFFSSFTKIVKTFESCSKKHGSLSTVDCHASILLDVKHSLTRFQQAVTTGQTEPSDYHETEKYTRLINSDEGNIQRQPEIIGLEHQLKVQQLQQSLNREQERAAHWQNLYLLERRQREWERENDDLEDRLARDQWVKEDEEQDRKEREQWEREEEEEDRRDRLLWELQDQQQDKRDRERWERERVELDNVECLKKLMNTNLTFLRQQIVPNWNVSAFNDFVNMSLLMSSITEMKKSVLTSVQQIWLEADQMLKKMSEEVKNGQKSYLDTSVMAEYLKQALEILRLQVESVVNVQLNENDSLDKRDVIQEKSDPPKRYKSNKGQKRDKSAPEKAVGNWNKVIGKIFKQTSKSLRKFMRTVSSSWKDMKSVWQKNVKTTSQTEIILPRWIFSDSCKSVVDFSGKKNNEKIMLDIGSPCVWKLRNQLSNKKLKELCKQQKAYSFDCNLVANSVWGVNNDLKQLLNAEEQFHGGNIAQANGKELLHMFEKFWKEWESDGFLLKLDREWVHCQLNWLSIFVNNEYKEVHDVGKSCSRLISLEKLLKEVEKLTEYSSNDENSDDDNNHHNENFLKINRYRYRNNKNEKFSRDYDDDDDDDDEESSRYDDEYEYDETEPEGNDYEGFNDNSMSIDQKPDSTSSMKEDNPSNSARKKNLSVTPLNRKVHSLHDYKKTEWYLKRVRHRIEMRRAQEKQSWFFDMSSHRNEKRMEHSTDLESTQWLFDKAADRAEQRKKEHESDWLFERAHERRQTFVRKLSSEQYDKYRNDKQQRKFKVRENKRHSQWDRKRRHEKYNNHFHE